MSTKELQPVTFEQAKRLKELGFDWGNFIEQEIWKDIADYEGLYQVSSLGGVKRLPLSRINPLTKTFNKNGKILSYSPNNKGYVVVHLFKNGIGRSHKVHRLVAKTFISNDENKAEVNHINGIKSDNRVANLEWVTRSENQKHAFSTGLNKANKSNKGKFLGNHSRARIIVEFDGNGKITGEFSSIKEATIICRKEKFAVFAAGKGST
ncbi:MAG: NUMOD4 motif-containing HNH endonuclease [Prevotellaceae bacterium]|jgi:hypothetical protein|nr:NUMOD4 motif-containing HNH endonuclease [Prevotellaceae bacterium]